MGSRVLATVRLRATAAAVTMALVAGATAETGPTRAQAVAAVALYKQAMAGCAGGQAAACEADARRRFVEVMGCVVQGPREADPATVDREFTAYAELIAGLLDRPESGPAGEPGPCFAGVAATPAAPGAAQEGPTLEALRRIREQSEEPSQPAVTPPPEEANEPTILDQLRRDLDAMRQRGQPGGARTLSPGPLQPRGATGAGSSAAGFYLDPAAGARVSCATPPSPGAALALRAWQEACAPR